MKIIFDSISSDYIYPLSKVDIAKIKKYVTTDIWNSIQYVRFGFSANSGHAGRMVRHGNGYRIRVNFCLKETDGKLQSPAVCRQERYLKEVKRYGGKPDMATKTIVWDLGSAKRYALYVLLHEIGHVVYGKKALPGSKSPRPTSKEEDWCDQYSAHLIQEIER